MYGVINQEAIIMCIQRRRLIKLSASLSGISRTRRSEGFVTTPDSSYYRSSGCTISAGQSPCVYGVDANSKNRNSMDVE
jgi:hypothetical protein